jgi:predicted metal-dependent HD superfamily phosphohydrolase
MIPIDAPCAKLLIAKHWEMVCSVTEIYGETEHVLVGVFERYSEPGRAYHNLVHIANMLLIIGGHDEYPEDLCELFVATVFHDIIYDPQAKDNEERSADYAMGILKPIGFDESFLAKVNAYILSTKDHKVNPNYPHSATMIDADLSILGARENEYQDYAKAIRQEYSFVLDEEYRMGRSKVLQGFLDRDSIYLLPQFREKFEESARSNISRELRALS